MQGLRKLVDSDAFRRGVIAVILVNAVHIGLETDPSLVLRYGARMQVVDWIVLGLFTLEMLLRLLAAEPRSAFFRDPWNWFDCVVIGAGYLPGSEFLTVFRLLRVLRLMRTVRILPGLKRIANAALDSIPSLANVLVILFLLFYVYGTAGTILYGAILPEKFGTLGRSLLTLCEAVTLGDWVSPMHRIMERAPYCWVFFLSFILLGSYFALSSAVQILINHLKIAEEGDELSEVKKSLARIEARLKGDL